MGIIKDYFDRAFRNFATEGVRASGPHEPIKTDIREIGLVIESQVAAAALAGGNLTAAAALMAPLLDSAVDAQEAAEAAIVLANDAIDEALAAASDFADVVAAGGNVVAIDEVKAAATGNINISNPGTAIFDGVTLSNDDRLLLGKQTDAGDNGIFIFHGSGSALTRATDFDQTAEVKHGSLVTVLQGTNMRGSWQLVTADPITVGTTDQAWRRFHYRDISRTDLADASAPRLIGYSHDETFPAGTLGDRLKREVWVTDEPFGAAGDGVADDTAAIQAALDSGASEIFFPTGTYKISGPITPSNNQRLHGPATFALYESANPFFFDVTGCDNVRFDGFRIDGRKSSFVYAYTVGAGPSTSSRSRYSFVFGTGMNNISVENCRFTNMYSSAVYLFGGITDERANVNGFKLLNCSYEDGRFEIADFVICGDVLVQGCRTNNSRNASGVPQLVANGMICTASNDVRVIGNYFGPSDGTGCKVESVNGPTEITGNTFELNDFASINLQESGIERGDVANHNEHVSITGNTFIRPYTFGVAANTSSANPVWNVTVTGNVFVGCIQGGVAISGDNWVVSANLFVGGSVTRAGVPVSPYGVLITQDNGHTVRNVTITGNTFNKNSGWGGGAGSRGDVQIAETTPQNMAARNLTISANTFRNPIFRGIYCQNNIDVSDVLIDGNQFVKDALDGTATGDIYVFNSTHAVKWTICNNVVSQRILCRLTFAGSIGAGWNNRVSATNSRDNVNAYYVDIDAPEAAVYDHSDRLAIRGTAAPSTGTWERGDIAWNSAPSAGGTIGWVCTTAGSPGTWKTFGAIAA